VSAGGQPRYPPNRTWHALRGPPEIPGVELPSASGNPLFRTAGASIVGHGGVAGLNLATTASRDTPFISISAGQRRVYGSAAPILATPAV